jgi:GntR family transcriptional repressor for pyruvate dehydrogenase complex
LEASAATIADVLTALSGIEAVAARSLAERGSPDDLLQLETILVDNFPRAFSSGTLPEAAALFHRRLFELTGNAALRVIAGMLHEITERHIAEVLRRRRNVSKLHYVELGRSYADLIDLLRIGDGDAAEAHWRRHMDVVGQPLVRGTGTVRVRDI